MLSLLSVKRDPKTLSRQTFREHALASLIDDNEDFRFTMSVFLERNGFEVVSAEDGEVGWQKIQTEKPDLILLDVMMESMFSGFEVCRQIRIDPDLKHIPIIGISAMNEEIGVQYDGRTDGDYFSVDDFLDKPIDKDVLIRKIDKLLKK